MRLSIAVKNTAGSCQEWVIIFALAVWYALYKIDDGHVVSVLAIINQN